MKRWLALLLLVLLPVTALADGPVSFTQELYDASSAEFAQACEAALADTSLAGSTVAEKDGAPIVAWSEYDAFAVMRRTDGLLMLCRFTPAGEKMMLAWHNDLLLSHYQDVSLTMQGAEWTGGILPKVWMQGSFEFTIRIFPHDGAALDLTAERNGNGWQVEKMAVYARTEAGSWQTALLLTEDCLADDIYLATCMPLDWRRGETEEEVPYGW